MNTVFRAFFVLAFSLFFTSGAHAEEPRIVAENPDFQFGQVYAGDKVEHTFHFKNAGEAPLVIDRVRSSCGCTAALLSSELIEPGGEGEVKTTFDSSRFRGQVAKTIYLYSNDPMNKVTQFHIRGRVRQEIAYTPSRINLGTIVTGKAREARITLTNEGEAALNLSGLRTTAPEVRAELSAETLPPGESTEVVIRVSPREGQERVGAYVLLKTSSTRTPELRIPITASVSKDMAGKHPKP